MPNTENIAAADALVASIRATPDPRLLDLITRLAETAARLMLGSYEPEHWQDTPEVAALREAAMLLREGQREVPPVIEEALWKADGAQ